MERLVTSEVWLKNREIEYQHLVIQKQGMDYIAWGDAEVLLNTYSSGITWEVEIFGMTEVKGTSVRVRLMDGDKVGQWYSLAVSDFKNNAILEPDATDVEDTIQRAFVKAVARETGLFHKLYEATTYKKSEESTAKIRYSNTSRMAKLSQADEF